jgi:AAA15 family ATPase/GTPase
MIERIKIQNFRGIQELEMKDFRQFNLIVGSNNVGKSSILEALFLTCTPMDWCFP